MKALVLKHRITFCFVLFTALIILDIFAALGTIAPLMSKESEDLALDNNKTAVGNKTNDEEVVGGKEWMSKEMEEASTVSVEVFALSVLLLSNLTALLGLQRTEAYLLVPWIFVYLVGICSSYIGATMLFVSQVNEGSLNTKIVYPLGTAIVFHLAWILVKSVFDDLKSGMMPDRSMQLQHQHYVELAVPSLSEGPTYQVEE